MTNTIHNDDLSVTIQFDLDDSKLNVKFVAWEITGTSDGVRYYEHRDSDSFDTGPTTDGACKLISGLIKWDGCCHYYFGDNEGYLHLCSPSDIRNLGEIVKFIYTESGKLMDNAEFEPLGD